MHKHAHPNVTYMIISLYPLRLFDFYLNDLGLTQNLDDAKKNIKPYGKYLI